MWSTLCGLRGGGFEFGDRFGVAEWLALSGSPSAFNRSRVSGWDVKNFWGASRLHLTDPLRRSVSAGVCTVCLSPGKDNKNGGRNNGSYFTHGR